VLRNLTRRRGCLSALLALFGILMAAAPARADLRNFTVTYDWFTPVRGEKEIEFWSTQFDGGVNEQALEFEYGVTDRWVVAPYLLLKREHDGGFHVNGWKLEQRYRLGNFARDRFLPALYFEVTKETDERVELEGKLITSYVFGNGWLWSHNFIFESKVQNGSKVEFGYAEGVRRMVTRRLSVGVELFGNFTDTKHLVGPALG